MADNELAAPRPLKWVAWGVFFATSVILVNKYISDASHTDVYVSPSGSDWNQGRTADSPVKSIARGLELVAESGTVHLLPGTYEERCHLNRGGTSSKPMRFIAETPGTVTITWKEVDDFCRHFNWSRLPTTQGVTLYTTTVSRPVYRLRNGESELFRIPWGGPQALSKLANMPGAHGAFCYAAGTLTVYLPGGLHPQNASLIFHRPVPEPREWGEFRSANLWIEGDHIEVSGITFDLGIGSAIRISDHSDITIKDCVFSGATYGVTCTGSGRANQQIQLESCLYHNFPQHHWRRDWLDWDEIYAAYSSSTLIASHAPGVHVTNCVVIHAGDALRITNVESALTDDVIVEENLLAYCTDDAVELDGASKNVFFRKNLVIDAHESLGTSPVEVGPCLIEQNVFVHPQVELNGAQIKFIGNQAGQRIQNIQIRENLFLGNWLVWRSDLPISDVHINKNLFVIRRQEAPTWPQGVTATDNLLVNLDMQPEALSLREAVETLNLNSVNAFPDANVILKERLQHAYGPSWWDWEGHVVTKELWKSLQSAAQAL